MNRPTFILTVAALMTAAMLRAQTASEIIPLNGEKWWGLFVGNSVQQPISSALDINTAEMDRGAFRTPCMISTAGRYIRSGEDFGIASDGQKFTITSHAGHVDPQKGGRTLRQAFLSMHHRNFSPAAKTPPAGFFTELIYETRADMGFMQTADDILAYARRLLDEGFPPGIMVVADGWKDPETPDFDKRWYPDPGAFVEEMHGMGFGIVLTVTPYIAAYGPGFARLGRQGLLIGGGQGAWTMEIPEGVCAVVDVRDARAADAVRTGMREMTEKYGIDGFRMDCLDFVEKYHGTDGGEARTRKDYLKVWEEIGAEFAMCEMSPGYPACRSDRVSFVRSGSCDQNAYLLDVVTAGLAAGPFTFVEPAAGPGTPEKALVRCALIQAMMPVARVPFAPWKYGFAADEIQQVLNFRAELSKYMGRMSGEAVKTVEPIIRPMEYQFANAGFADCTQQYMLGDKYLIAPAVDDSPRRLVRLPKGVWRDRDGRKHKGPVVLEAETDGFRMTWFELQ